MLILWLPLTNSLIELLYITLLWFALYDKQTGILKKVWNIYRSTVENDFYNGFKNGSTRSILNKIKGHQGISTVSDEIIDLNKNLTYEQKNRLSLKGTGNPNLQQKYEGPPTRSHLVDYLKSEDTCSPRFFYSKYMKTTYLCEVLKKHNVMLKK